MNKLYTLCLAFLCAGMMNAQEVGVSVELVYSDDGTVADYPTGFSTWRIYAVLPDATDFLSSVYATYASAPLTITTSTDQIWNSELGGVSTLTVNSAIYDLYPVAEYDSFITIGQEDMNGVGPVTHISLAPSTSVIDDSFGVIGTGDYIAPNLSMIDGAWFNLMDDPDGVAGADLKVLVAQVTTNGDIEVCMNFQVFTGGQNGNLTFYDEYCDAQLSPLSISEFEVPNQMTVTPNPMVEQVKVDLNGMNAKYIYVRDVQGKTVQTVAVNSQVEIINRNGMHPGFYLLQVADNTGTILESQRLIVK